MLRIISKFWKVVLHVKVNQTVIMLVVTITLAEIIFLPKVLHNLKRQTLLEMKVHLVIQILWIFQTMIFRFKKNIKKEKKQHGSTTSWRIQTP
ncbi:single-strand DNA-binding protein [Streptococcus mutans AC4446]|nr:single-strand DNA-binding protein [Streptococcus mutans KK23]EMP63328.1 single-strand DNA-binding protein [Streptococcus mutans AC4446]